MLNPAVRVAFLSIMALASLAVGAQTHVFVSGADGYHTYRIPALAVTKSGTLLAFCEGRKTGSGDAGDIDLLVKRSDDGGATWGKQQLVWEEGGDAPITIGNPCCVVDRDSGRVHLLFTRNNEHLFRTWSDDEGQSWQPPVELTEVLTSFDFAWTRVGSGPGHAIQLQSGRLLAPIWINEKIGAQYRSAAIYSDDRGETWHAGGLVGPEVSDTNECSAAQLPDGRICLNMRAQGGEYRAVSFSDDEGESWSPVAADANLPSPVCQGSMLQCAAGLLFAHPAGPGRTALTVRTSADAGATWPVSHTLFDGPSAYNDLADLGEGRIGCLAEQGGKGPYERIVFYAIDMNDGSVSKRVSRLYVIGDSTAASYPADRAPLTGWAQVLQDYFDPAQCIVENRAISGRSSKSFLEEGSWTPIKHALMPGDTVFIQFGHNDANTKGPERYTDPQTTYKEFLTTYVNDTRERGALPLLLTSISRNPWGSDGSFEDRMGDYPPAVRELAATLEVPLLDPHQLTMAYLKEIGPEKARVTFLNLEKGESPNYPDGKADNTHLQTSGAIAICELIVGAIQDSDLPIKASLKN